MNVIIRRIGQFAAVLLMSAGISVAVAQDDLRETLFAQTDEALKAANEARANVLAPKNYGDAAAYYRSAEDKLKRGKSIESIKKDLDDAAQSMRKAVEATRIAGVTLASAIQARNDAEEADAAKYAAKQWRDAEVKFASAAKRLEEGNVNSARSRGNDAEELFRVAELAAIKANYLDEARRLIKQADDDRVDRYAPKTLAKAESLLTKLRALDNRFNFGETEYMLARYFEAVGDDNKALAQLEKSIARGYSYTPSTYQNDPQFIKYSDQAEFQSILTYWH